MIPKLVKDYGETAQLDICIEECAELIHAISKYKRSKGMGYRTGEDKALTMYKLKEALADAVNAIRGVMLVCGVDGHIILKNTFTADMKADSLKAMAKEDWDKWEQENACLIKLLPEETKDV